MRHWNAGWLTDCLVGWERSRVRRRKRILLKNRIISRKKEKAAGRLGAHTAVMLRYEYT